MCVGDKNGLSVLFAFVLFAHTWAFFRLLCSHILDGTKTKMKINEIRDVYDNSFTFSVFSVRCSIFRIIFFSSVFSLSLVILSFGQTKTTHSLVAHSHHFVCVLAFACCFCIHFVRNIVRCFIYSIETLRLHISQVPRNPCSTSTISTMSITLTTLWIFGFALFTCVKSCIQKPKSIWKLKIPNKNTRDNATKRK